MRGILFGCAFVAGCGLSDATVETSVSPLDGTIRVTAYHWASDVPFAGTQVEFIAPDQSVQTVVTDTNGVAEAVSPPNTRVVVFQDGERTGSSLVRIFDAANPGDDIIAGRRASVPGVPLGTITFALPPRTGWDRIKENGLYYMLRVSCSSDNGWWSLPTRDMRVSSCPNATHATAVGWIENGSGELLTGASVLRDVDLTAHIGETIHMPAYAPKLTTVSAQFVNTPPNTRLQWETASYYGDDPTVFAYGSTFSAQPDVVNTRASLGVGDRTASSLELDTPFETHLSQTRIEEGLAPSYFVDADAGHRMRRATFPSFSPYSQSITWSVTSDGLPPAMVYASLTGFTPDSRIYRIEVYAPGDATSLTLPALPAELTPQLNDSIHTGAFFYRISNETYSQWLQVHSSRDALNPIWWSSEMPREIWISF